MKVLSEVHPQSSPAAQAAPVKEPALRSVIESIPERFRPLKPSIPKGLAYFALDVALYLVSLWGMISGGVWLYLPSLVLNVFSIGGLFIVAHDCCHGSLFGNKSSFRRALAYFVGQSAMLTGGHMYQVWEYGHNRVHHGHTVKQEFDFVWHPVTPEQYQKLGLFGRWWHRLCWSPVGHGLYYFIHIWIGKMWVFRAAKDRAMSWRVTRDKIIVGVYLVTVAGLFFWFLGFWAWVRAIAVPFVLWNHYIGFVVYVQHIHEMVIWRVRRAWTPFRGQVEGTVTFRFPSIINFLSHNIFVHTPHHVDMRIPFYYLPKAMTSLRERYSSYIIEHPFKLREYLSTTRQCKMFDFELGRWFESVQAYRLALARERREGVLQLVDG